MDLAEDDERAVSGKRVARRHGAVVESPAALRLDAAGVPLAAVGTLGKEGKLLVDQLVRADVVLLPGRVHVFGALEVALPVRRDSELRFGFGGEDAKVVAPAGTGDYSLAVDLLPGAEDNGLVFDNVNVLPYDLKVSSFQSTPKVVQCDETKTGIAPETTKAKISIARLISYALDAPHLLSGISGLSGPMFAFLSYPAASLLKRVIQRQCALVSHLPKAVL